MAEDVAGAVEAGTLAVPHAEHAVVLALAPQLRLLRAPQRGRGEVLVEAGHELDVVGLQDALGAQHRRLEAGDRRAAIARHVARRIEPRLLVAGALRQHQAHDRLRPGQDLPGLVQRIFVIEADGVLGHVGLGLFASSSRAITAAGGGRPMHAGKRCQSPGWIANPPWPSLAAHPCLKDGRRATLPQSSDANRLIRRRQASRCAAAMPAFRRNIVASHAAAAAPSCHRREQLPAAAHHAAAHTRRLLHPRPGHGLAQHRRHASRQVELGLALDRDGA